MLGWRPQTALADGLKRTIAYFEAVLTEPGVRQLLSAQA